MATICGISLTDDIDVSVDEFWESCDYKEREELRDLVAEEFNISRTESLNDAVMGILGSLVEGVEAKEYVRKVLSEMEWKLRNRDFS